MRPASGHLEEEEERGAQGEVGFVREWSVQWEHLTPPAGCRHCPADIRGSHPPFTAVICFSFTARLLRHPSSPSLCPHLYASELSAAPSSHFPSHTRRVGRFACRLVAPHWDSLNGGLQTSAVAIRLSPSRPKLAARELCSCLMSSGQWMGGRSPLVV